MHSRARARARVFRISASVRTRHQSHLPRARASAFDRGGSGATYFTGNIGSARENTIFLPLPFRWRSMPGEVLRRGQRVPGYNGRRRRRRDRRGCVRLRSEMRAEASTGLCQQRQGLRQSLRAAPHGLQHRHVVDHAEALQMSEQW